MGLLLAILLGALVGYIASRLLGRDEGFVMSTVIGVVGAVVGNLVSRLLGAGNQAGLAFDWSQLLWSLAGAIIVVAVINAVQNRYRRNRGL